MEINVDLHLHGKYSRATSSYLSPVTIGEAAKIKGIHVIGTGDFTHPQWIEMFKNLEERDGLLRSNGVSFMLSVEVNNVFEYNNRQLNIHNVILTNSLESAHQIFDVLEKYGDLSKDGRPNIRLSMMEMMDILKSLNKKTEVFAAHIWTPWFSILGARNKLKEIREVIDDRLLAVETGLSADPAMTAMTSAADFPVISNSDAHSPDNIGREATRLDVDKISYDSIIAAIKSKKIVKTYEFYPQEGKYYYDGHRSCNVHQHPEESIKNQNICRVCGRKLTIGVLHRVMELKDGKQRNVQRFQYIIPIRQVLAYVMNLSPNSSRLDTYYMALLNRYQTELNIYDSFTREDLVSILGKSGEAVYRILKGDVEWEPGYDGVYGVFRLKQQGILEQLKH